MGGVCVYIYDLLKAVWINSNFTLKKKAALTTLDVSIGLILIAIALDAVLAIVEWRVWLYDIVSFFCPVNKKFVLIGITNTSTATASSVRSFDEVIELGFSM